MSDLLVTRLDTSLSQQLTTTELSVIAAVRPHIYIEGSPPGSLRVDLYDSSDTTLLKSSEELTIANIKTQAGITESFFHGYIKFDIDWGLADETTFNVRLVGTSGYTATATDAVYWCKDFDLRKYSANFTPNIGFNSAFDVEFWVLQDNVRAV